MSTSTVPQLDRRLDWRLLVTLGLILASMLGLAILSHGAPVLLHRKLAEFPQMLANLKGIDYPIDEKVIAVLGATDLLNRVYVDPAQKSQIGLFVGFFSSQQKGGAIHSPKNCLPGAGWSVLEGGTIPLQVPGRPQPVVINRYIIQNGLNRQLVLYWYQSQGRVIASEYSAKFYLIWDALRRNRTDGALVRVITPILDGNEAAAMDQAKSFIEGAFPLLTEYLPS